MKNTFKKLFKFTSLIFFISLLLTSWKPSTFPGSGKPSPSISAYSPLNDCPNEEILSK